MLVYGPPYLTHPPCDGIMRWEAENLMEGRFPRAVGIQVCKDYMTFVRECTTK